MFPSDPDPMMRFVDEEGIPYAFWSLAPQDRARRIRLFLIAQAAQGSDYSIVDWVIALDMTPAGEKYAREVVDPHDDAEIEAMIVDGRRRWKGYLDALAAGQVDTGQKGPVQ